MAQIYPKEVHAKSPDSELKLRRLLSDLDDRWCIFHSVAWQSKRKGREGDGEADFVIVNAERGILIVEVKGGRIQVHAGAWESTDREGITHTIKDPFQQAMESKHALLSYFKDVAPELTAIALGHAVALPDITVRGTIAPNAPRDIVLDTRDVLSLETSLLRVFDHWGAHSRISQQTLSKIIARLAPTVTFRQTLADRATSVNEQLTSLTQGQIQAISGLRRVRQALVTGGPGTGKTIVAIEKAKQLARDGFSTLLICYNDLLCRHVREQLKDTPGVTVVTFHALAMREAAKAGLQIPRHPDTAWWSDTAPAMLAEAATSNGFRPDAIIVDEGQDFEWDWIDALQSIQGGRENAVLYVFTDARQDLYRRPWCAPSRWTQYELTINCRNTLQIAKDVAFAIGDTAPLEGPTGPESQFLETDFDRLGTRPIEKLVGRLISDEKVNPKQIVVLSDDARMVKDLRTKSAANYVFCAYGEAGIVAETVARFKGLESDVVILAFSCKQERTDLAFRTTCYVAMSRAKVSLYVLWDEQVCRLAKWRSI